MWRDAWTCAMAPPVRERDGRDPDRRDLSWHPLTSGAVGQCTQRGDRAL